MAFVLTLLILAFVLFIGYVLWEFSHIYREIGVCVRMISKLQKGDRDPTYPSRPTEPE